MRRLAAIMLVVLAALTVASVPVFLAQYDSVTLARQDADRGGRIANTKAGPIEYTERGAGIPVLSIHGAGGGYDQGLANAADLLGEGFRVIAPSRFGYLRTPVPDTPSVAAQADAHAALLAELKVRQSIVVGVSAGARSAAELALRYPERVAALILVAPATYVPDSPVGIEDSPTNAMMLWLVNNGADFAWWTAEHVAPQSLVRFLGVPPELVAGSPPAEQARVMNIVHNVQPLSRRVAGINIDSTPEPGRPALEAIRAPTLVVSARDDLLNTLPAANYAARTIPGATQVVYETGGHLLVGRQQELRKAVGEFIARRMD